jgi:hypothetical protein
MDFSELCDRLQQNDGTLTKVDGHNVVHLFLKNGYGQRLGAALERNTAVTQLHVRLDGLLKRPKDVQTVPTGMHHVAPLWQFIKTSPTLRNVKVSTNGCHADAALATLILDAVLQNPGGAVAFLLDTWQFSSEAVTHALGGRPSPVSLELSIHYDLGKDVQAVGCAMAELDNLQFLKVSIQEHLDLILLPLVGHGALRCLQIYSLSGNDGTVSEVESLVAVLGHCANIVQHLVLKNFSWTSTHWISLFQGLQHRASGCSMQRLLPLQSATFKHCRFNDKASAAIFTGYTNTTEQGLLQQQPLVQLSGIRALKLVDCSYGSYLYMDYTFPDLSGYLSATPLLTRLELYDQFHHARTPLPSDVLRALHRNGSLYKVTIRSLPENRIPWSVERYVRAITSRNKQIPKILATIGGEHSDDACSNQQLVPTLFAVAFRAGLMTTLLAGLFSVRELDPRRHMFESVDSVGCM